MAYPYNIGNNVTITSSGAGDQYYYFYYDLEIQELLSNVITGCTDTSQVVTITQPNEITINETVDDVDCNGGSTGGITVNVQGGTPQYTHSWSNGGTTASISGLSAGMYDYTVVDANGCSDTLVDILVD